MPPFYLNMYQGGFVGIQQREPYAITRGDYGALESRLKEDLGLCLERR